MDLEVELDDNSGGVTPMEGVEEESTPYPNSGMASTMPNLSTRREQSLPIPPPTAAMSATMRAVTSPAAVERMPSSPPQPRSSPRKSHLMKLKKRDNTMNKVLHVTTVPAKASSSLVYVEVEVDHNPDDDLLGTVKADIDRNSLSAVIASRLAMAPDDAKLKAVTARERKAVYYLAGIFDRAGVESGALAGKSNEDMVLTEMLKEIQDLAVSYCASSLTVPDLFESAVAAPSQLFSCLSTNSHNIASGSASSFLHRVCKELLEQEELESILSSLLSEGIKSVKNECILDPSFQTSLYACRALTALFSYKQCAVMAAKDSSFLLPPPSSPNANAIVAPDLTGYDTAQQNFMRMMMSMQARQGNGGPGLPARAYKQRSGPAVEKTLLGTFLSLGLPLRDTNFVAQFNNAARRTIIDINNVRGSLRKQSKAVRDATDALIMSLLKGGAPSRTSVLTWLADALLVNISATVSFQYRDSSKVSSQHTLLNIAQALLKLSMPFVNDAKKRKLIDVRFVSNENAHLGVYTTTGDDKVDRLGGEEAAQSKPTDSSNGDFNFTTQCFFLTARALNLGLFPLTNQLKSLGQHLGHMNYQIRARGGDATSDPRFQALHAQQLCVEVLVADSDFLRDVVKFYDLAAETLLSCDKPTMQSMPEFFVDDICEILTHTVRAAPDVLKGLSLGNIFNLVVLLLSEEHAKTIRNYNLRARLGNILFNVFLPSESKREDEGGYSGYSDDVPYSVCCDPSNGSPFLLSSKSAQETLAPSLLLLYGQVEHTGPYDKQGYRSNICSLLRYLWNSTEHRTAFAKIASNKQSFIEFANGVLNETNQLILVMMDKLPQIKNIQDEMKSQAWVTKSQDDQDEVTSRLKEHEQEVRSALMLANKTMKMFAFLSTDEKIAELFQGKELCTRLVNVLLYVLQNMLGHKGLELKVDNPESYHFKPKELLADLVSILTCYVDSPAIHAAMAQCGYYNDKLLHKLLKTTTKLGIKDSKDDRLDRLITAVESAKVSSVNMDEILADHPEEFGDPLTMEIMRDPVTLPTSDTVVDRSTIVQHLLNTPIDPFNRKPLTMDQVVPNTELKAKIEGWITMKVAEAQQKGGT